MDYISYLSSCISWERLPSESLLYCALSFFHLNLVLLICASVAVCGFGTIFWFSFSSLSLPELPNRAFAEDFVDFPTVFSPLHFLSCGIFSKLFPSFCRIWKACRHWCLQFPVRCFADQASEPPFSAVLSLCILWLRIFPKNSGS